MALQPTDATSADCAATRSTWPAANKTPFRWLIHQRVHASLSLLEDTDGRIEDIAYTVGFDSPVTYRHHLNQTMGTPPSAMLDPA